MPWCCFASGQARVYASGLEVEHEAALKAAEALLFGNAGKKVTDLYGLSTPVGQGAFAKVVECVHKVSCFSGWLEVHRRSVFPKAKPSIRQQSHVTVFTMMDVLCRQLATNMPAKFFLAKTPKVTNATASSRRLLLCSASASILTHCHFMMPSMMMESSI